MNGLQREFIFFCSDHIRYLCPIEYTREIIESAQFTPYPLVHSFHLGVVNVRGQILPVVSFSKIFDSSINALKNVEHDRMILFGVDADQNFCVWARNIEKLSLSEEQFKDSEIVEVHGEPAQMLNLEALVQKLGEKK